MRLHELLGDVDVLEWRGDNRVEVTAIVHDNRLVTPGACFACIPGAVTDGHAHAAAAVDAGAVALLVERVLDVDASQARVPSVRQVLGPAAARLLADPSAALRCLGVTGTNGKTTTTYLLEAIARVAGERVGVIGTIEARIAGEPVPLEHTTPEATELQTLLARMRDAGIATVAMEVSSHALDQHRVDGIHFAAVCFTNLTHEHLDYHGTLDAYFDAKARLFDPARTAAAAANADDRYGAEIIRRSRAAGLPTLTFALDADADVMAGDVREGSLRSNFELVWRPGGERGRVHLTLPGRFNIANALAAAATALAAGIPFDAVVAGLSEPLVVPGRFEPVDAGQPFTVLVDYAHKPDALARVLTAARPLTGPGNVIVVFGCGGDRDRLKRPLMGRAAATGADFVVVTSDNPRSEDPEEIAAAAVAGVREGHTEYVVELDRRTAIHLALARAGPGDVVVVAGKGHETGQTVGEVTRPFDDRVVVREELEALGCA